jgi:hypothetical protein
MRSLSSADILSRDREERFAAPLFSKPLLSPILTQSPHIGFAALLRLYCVVNDQTDEAVATPPLVLATICQ